MKTLGKKKWIQLVITVFIVFTLVGCGQEEESQSTPQPVNSLTEVTQEIKWQDKIKEISISDKTETEKFDEVTMMASDYSPNADELLDFESYIQNEFESGKYLSDITNHEYMLTNIFIATVVEKHYNDLSQKPIDKFAFDFLQNTKYTYRGAETVDSESVKANEDQMNKTLTEIK